MANQNQSQDKDSAPRLLVDLNSLLNAALLGGKDPDGEIVVQDGKPISINSARYGVDRFFERLSGILEQFDAAPRNVIGVWDGERAKAVRQALLPGYKAPSKAAPVYEQLNLARPIINQMLHDLGAHTVACETCEADDTIAYLVERLRTRRNIVVTGDGDLSVLTDENTSVLKLDNSGRGKGDRLDENPFGPFPAKHITVYKALVGDTSDKIPGAKGFGDAAFVKLVAAFGLDGLEMMEQLIATGKLASLAEDVGEMKELQKIIDSAEQVTLSWRCAKLMPERVNTLRHPLQWRAGFVKLWNELAEADRVAALKKHYGTVTLVHAGNYERMKQALGRALAESPVVSLDIETSVSEESLDWIEQTKSKGGKGVAVDVLGSTLTGMSLGFGGNLQHTVYLTVDHREESGVTNITSEQARQLVELVPADTQICTWNAQFELVVLANEWGEAWKGNGWDGMLPNCIDAMMGASHVNENIPLGLKGRAESYLGFTQETYAEVTTIDGVQRQMNELTAAHVLSYGADDARTTAALHTFQSIVMQIEGSWWAFTELEQKCAYMTARATINGVDVDLSLLKQYEAEDREKLEASQRTIFEFLSTIGWDGTTCPVFTEVTPAAVKEAVGIVLGAIGEDAEGAPVEFASRKRKLEALAADIRAQYEGRDEAELLAGIVEQGRVDLLNEIVARHFDGQPKLNFRSPPQVRKFLYEAIGMKLRLLTPMTVNQRADGDFAKAFYAHRDYISGDLKREPTEQERAVWLSKSSTDDSAVQVALRFEELSEQQRALLQAYLDIKSCATRASLYYDMYPPLLHWKTGRLHPKYRQNQANTRRWSSSEPSSQTLGNKGDGLKIRRLWKPKRPDWIMVSADASGQELRSSADYSRDPAFLACYIGDNLLDPHTSVAARASRLFWDRAYSYDEIQALRKSPDEAEAHRASDLRNKAKIGNFLTLYSGTAPTLAQQLFVSEQEAQGIIDSIGEAFPGVERWRNEQARLAEETGTVRSRCGGVRHLRDAVLSPNRWERNKALRQSGNFPVQSGGASSIKWSLNKLWRDGLFDGRLQCQMVAIIHDEIVIQVARDDAVEAIRILHNAMTEGFPGMIVPSASSVAIGRDLSMPVELGETFTDEQVAEEIEKLFEEPALAGGA